MSVSQIIAQRAVGAMFLLGGGAKVADPTEMVRLPVWMVSFTTIDPNEFWLLLLSGILPGSLPVLMVSFTTATRIISDHNASTAAFTYEPLPFLPLACLHKR